MKFLMTLTLCLFLAACQPQNINQIAQQQHQVCKSLIEGFLKIQNLGSYQFDSVTPHLDQTVQNRNYTFRTSPDHQMRLNMPQQQNLEFECVQNQAQLFELKLLDKNNKQSNAILILQLPTEKAMRAMTAYALNK